LWPSFKSKKRKRKEIRACRRTYCGLDIPDMPCVIYILLDRRLKAEAYKRPRGRN
jgi:hypothetical protein